MIRFFVQIIDWSEAWATLIPLSVFAIKKTKQKFSNPVFIYLCVALLLNTFADIIWKFRPYPFSNGDNNFLYNIHSICRLFLLLLFFTGLHFKPFKIKNGFILLFAAILILVNFIFFQSFKKFSSNLFTFESLLLLIYSLGYLVLLINTDKISTDFNPSLFIVTGIAVYEAVNFFIFLFHDALTKQNPDFSAAIWKVHDYVFIALCLFFTKAFYGERKLSLTLSA
jgi:hypothetical protein